MLKNKTEEIFQKVLSGESISFADTLRLYNHASTSELIFFGNKIRQQLHPENHVGWIIDRNVNITNICFVQCKFCNFCRKTNDEDSYITTIDDYKQKLFELKKLGGNQLLLQGGLHPKLGLKFYKKLFEDLKIIEPNLRLHALGPAEVFHIAKLEKATISETLQELIKSGLDSLPGAGAEILSDRVRQFLSKAKCTSSQWLEVMHEAHKLNLPTSATMMFGHIETIEERLEHLFKIRETQAAKPKKSKGFITFVPWPFQDDGTELKNKLGIKNTTNAEEYIRLIALSRIVLNNIKNIQASWLTVGINIGQLCLQSGANDFGSIMIEENVVSAAGANFSLNTEGIQKAIKEAGFKPRKRNQKYEWVD